MKNNISRFTLIELLVVVAVIAILAGLLLPALKKARDMAKSGACMSNMRQVGYVYTNYVLEQDSFLPTPNSYEIVGSDETRNLSWTGDISLIKRDYFNLSSANTGASYKRGILDCPSRELDKQTKNDGTVVTDVRTHYSLSYYHCTFNSIRGGDYNTYDHSPERFLPTGYPKPSSTFWIVDPDVMGYAEDLGMQNGPMISPDHFRKFIKPIYKRLMAPALQSS